MRAPVRLAVIAIVALVAAIGLAGPASAHNVLISSDPADGAVLNSAPATVRLTFDQPVQDFEPVVTVLGADGQRYESGAPQVDSTEVTAAVAALPGAGDYTIAYRVVSADGHPVQGEIKFRLDAPGSASAGASASATGSVADSATGSAADSATAGNAPASSAAPAPPATAAVAPASSSSGLSGWVWAAIVLAVVLIAAAIVVIVRRPRSDQQ